jgi:actin-like ATPase involved in cell morphogenesis
MCALGLDIGTCNLVSATKDAKNSAAAVEVKSIRDAFLDIEVDQTVLNMLKMSNISYVQENDIIYIVGEPALNVANLKKCEVRRPLNQGVISAGELDAEKMLYILLKSIISSPKVENEVVFFSVPAKPIDKVMDIVYHEAIFKKIIESFGFKAHSMNEAAALVFSNSSKENFTALSSSFGAGLVNTALVYQTMIGMAFSVAQSGDYIDQSAARAVNTTATRIMTIKEKGVNLLDPNEGDLKQLREREAIIVYYRNLIHYVIDSIVKEFKKSNNMMEIQEAIPWIIGGGTAKAKNFLEFFKQEFEKKRSTFPIPISEIRLVNDPLADVAKGLLIAAMND